MRRQIIGTFLLDIDIKPHDIEGNNNLKEILSKRLVILELRDWLGVKANLEIIAIERTATKKPLQTGEKVVVFNNANMKF